MAIQFVTQNIKFKLKNKSTIKTWIDKVILQNKKATGNIVFIFTNDEDLLELNIKFLNHNTFTDIITFDYNEGTKVNGEIYVSVDRVEENAKKLSLEFESELHRVIIHGILHLCGYKDKTKIDSGNMRTQEDKALVLLKRLNK